MSYNKNISIIQNNIVVISGSQIQATGSLFVSNISGTTAQFTQITASVISASQYVGITAGSTPGGADQSIQFNSGSNLNGSSLLIYNYTTNTLSGTTAEFTTVTASNVLIYGTASLFTNPQAAYLVYNSGSDKLVAYPGLIVSGALTASGPTQLTTVSGTTAQFTTITGTNISTTTLIASNGAASTPSITFVGDSDTGFYWNGSSGDIGVANNGSRTFVLGAAGMSAIGGGIFLRPTIGNTATSPAYTFATDLDTGMYRPSENNIAFTTSGSQRILITDIDVSISGNLNVNGGQISSSASTLIIVAGTTVDIKDNTIISGSLIVSGSITGSSINITGTISGSSAQSIIKSDQGISFRTRDNGTGSFTERMFISTNDTINIYSSLNTTSLTASVITANVITSSVVLTGSTALFTLISGSTITGSIARFTNLTSSNIFYSASNPEYWSGSAPNTISQAINRLAAVVYNILTGTIP